MPDYGLTGLPNIAQGVMSGLNVARGFSPSGMISGVLGGIGNLLGNAGMAQQQRRNLEEQNRANMNLAQYQYSTQVDMWNRANAYNTPAAQMQRFKDAGLNPNLIYGQGNAGNSPNVLPQYHAPDVNMMKSPLVNIPAALSAYQDMSIKGAQLSNLKAQNENIQQDTANKAVQQAIMSLNAGKLKAGMPFWDYNALNEYQRNIAQLQMQEETGHLRRYQADMEEKRVNAFTDTLKLSLKNADATLKNTIARTTGQNLYNQWQQNNLKFFVPDKVANYLGIIGGVLRNFMPRK